MGMQLHAPTGRSARSKRFQKELEGGDASQSTKEQLRVILISNYYYYYSIRY